MPGPPTPLSTAVTTPSSSSGGPQPGDLFRPRRLNAWNESVNRHRLKVWVPYQSLWRCREHGSSFWGTANAELGSEVSCAVVVEECKGHDFGIFRPLDTIGEVVFFVTPHVSNTLVGAERHPVHQHMRLRVRRPRFRRPAGPIKLRQVVADLDAGMLRRHTEQQEGATAIREGATLPVHRELGIGSLDARIELDSKLVLSSRQVRIPPRPEKVDECLRRDVVGNRAPGGTLCFGEENALRPLCPVGESGRSLRRR